MSNEANTDVPIEKDVANLSDEVEEKSNRSSKWTGTIVLTLFSIYVGILCLLTIDSLGGFSWFPTKLEKRIRDQIIQLKNPSRPDKKLVKQQLRESARFVVIPELIRSLNSDSLEIRKGSADLLKELTKDDLKGDLMGYQSEAKPVQRKEGQHKLLKWWRSVKEKY